MMLLGVQGCGRACARVRRRGILSVPLLRLRFRQPLPASGTANRKRTCAIRSAPPEGLAPCVLWVDEIEKALAGSGDSDGGGRRRVLGDVSSPGLRSSVTHLRRRHRRTTSPRCHRSWSAKAASTKSSSWICRTARRARTSSRFTARKRNVSAEPAGRRRWRIAAKGSPQRRFSGWEQATWLPRSTLAFAEAADERGVDRSRA